MEGKKDMTWLWRTLVGGLVSVIIGVSAWSATSIIELPEKYVQQDEYEQQRQENREDHQRILDKIDKILEKL